MTIWLRKVGLSTAALAMALVMGGCDGGSGGGDLLKLYFGINGTGDCSQVTVNVDLEKARAVIATDAIQEPRCEIDSTLDLLGCTASFTIVDGIFTAVIGNCTIPAVHNLFFCLFESGSIERIRVFSDAICSCDPSDDDCDGTPDLCIDEDPDPTSCEDCSNGVDDDGDGLVDCEDPACVSDPACAISTLPPSSTTTTTTSSSTTTTTESSTTSSTTTLTTTSTTTSTSLPCSLIYQITWRLDDAVNIGALQWVTDYSQMDGEIVGSGGIPGQGGDLQCASLIENATASFCDDDRNADCIDSPGEDNITQGLTSVSGFTGPVDLTECTACLRTAPQAEDFDITVENAADPNLTEHVPPPSLSLKFKFIDDGKTDSTSTTTTSVTVTTLDTTTTSTTTLPQQPIEIVFTLADAVTVGALQFDVGYGSASGVFKNNGGTVDCNTTLVSGGLTTANDNASSRVLSAGTIALGGFTGPAPVLSCAWDTQGAAAPAPGDFTVNVKDASTPALEPIDPKPAVTVSVSIP